MSSCFEIERGPHVSSLELKLIEDSLVIKSSDNGSSNFIK